jgi:hypothetical protein
MELTCAARKLVQMPQHVEVHVSTNVCGMTAVAYVVKDDRAYHSQSSPRARGGALMSAMGFHG